MNVRESNKIEDFCMWLKFLSACNKLLQPYDISHKHHGNQNENTNIIYTKEKGQNIKTYLKKFNETQQKRAKKKRQTKQLQNKYQTINK